MSDWTIEDKVLELLHKTYCVPTVDAIAAFAREVAEECARVVEPNRRAEMIRRRFGLEQR